MKPCRMAGAQCPREATLTARIAMVGDRDLCQQCHDALSAMGMAIRVLEPGAHVPPWRQRDLRRDMQGVR